MLLRRGLAAEQPTKKKNMPQFAANLSLLFAELPLPVTRTRWPNFAPV
jgi:hypothetical protein